MLEVVEHQNALPSIVNDRLRSPNCMGVSRITQDVAHFVQPWIVTIKK